MALRSIFSAIGHVNHPLGWASRARLAPVIMVAGIAAAAWGQYILLSEPAFAGGREFALRGALLMAGGGLAFLAALLMGWQALGAREILDEEREESAATSLPWGLRQTAGLVVGILGGLAGFFLNDIDTLGNSTFTAWGFFPWLAGLVGLVLGFWPPPGRVRFRLPRLNLSSAWVLVALVFTLGLAAFLRFYHLDSVLREMNLDHAISVSVIRSVRDGAYPIFVTVGLGREGLFSYWGAGLSLLFGYSFLTIKLSAAIPGVLAVGATYFMTRELFGNRRVALIAAILISLSFWHIIVSRVGFNYSLSPLTVALTLAFLFRALKYNRSSDFVLAGLFLGLGLHFHAGVRVVPLAVGLILIVSLLSRLPGRRGEAHPFIINSVLLVITALAAFAPLARYALEEPDLYWLRTRQISIQDEFTLGLLGDGVERALLMFNWLGGPTGLGNAPDSAQLDYVTGAAFALGVGAMALFWLLRRRGLNAYAGLAFLILLVPTIGSITDPSGFSTRSSGVIPLVFAVAALPFYMASELLVKAFGSRAIVLGLPLLGVVLGLIGFVNYHTYFDDYAGYNARTFPYNATGVAAVFRDFEDGGGDIDNAYLRPTHVVFDLRILAIEIGDLDWSNLLADVEEAREHALNPEAKLYVGPLDDGTTVLRLREIYPRGITYKFESSRSDPGRDFDLFVFLVPAKGEAPMTPLPNTHIVR